MTEYLWNHIDSKSSQSTVSEVFSNESRLDNSQHTIKALHDISNVAGLFRSISKLIDQTFRGDKDAILSYWVAQEMIATGLRCAVLPLQLSHQSFSVSSACRLISGRLVRQYTMPGLRNPRDILS